MILVTGATGTIGRRVVAQLVERGVPVRALIRDPGRARLPAGVEIATGDYADPDSLAAAMAGAEAAFLVGVLGLADADGALVDAARAAGVRRVVKLSAIGTGDPALGAFSTRHMPGERAVRDSGLQWTILRPSVFASNTLSWAPAIRAGELVPDRTGPGQQGVIDPGDVAAVAVAALCSGEHTGQVYTLTGPEVLSDSEMAAILADALGSPVRMAQVSEDAVRAHMRSVGLPEDDIEVALRSAQYIRSGGNAVLTDDVAHVLGRSPRGFAEWVADNVAAFHDPAGADLATS